LGSSEVAEASTSEVAGTVEDKLFVITDKVFTSIPVVPGMHQGLVGRLRAAVVGPGSLPAGLGRTRRWGLFRDLSGALWSASAATRR
jgi:hypothetical protein